MEEGEGDVAQLVPPIATNANGLQRMISLLRTGTSEVQSMLGAECNVILECKRCRSLFRSVANFIAHKRSYCGRPQPLETLSASSDDCTSIQTISNDLARRDLDNIVGRLSLRASQNASDGVRCLDSEVSQRSQYFSAVAEAVKERRATKSELCVTLRPLEGTSQAMAQSCKLACPPSTNSDSHIRPEEISSDIAGSEKRSRGRPRKISLDQLPALKPLPDQLPNYCCEKCNAQFSTQRSLNVHESTQHVTTRVQYKCPCCPSIFCNLWSTYRHLKSIHNKTQEQVEKLKKVIRKQSFRLAVPVLKAQPAVLSEQDKAWVGSDNNFTVDVGDHRCGVCGLKFERRAALISHTNTCHKRPAVRPTKSPRSASPAGKRLEGAANRKSSVPMKVVRALDELLTCTETLSPSNSPSPTSSQSSDKSLPPRPPYQSPIKMVYNKPPGKMAFSFEGITGSRQSPEPLPTRPTLLSNSPNTMTVSPKSALSSPRKSPEKPAISPKKSPDKPVITSKKSANKPEVNSKRHSEKSGLSNKKSTEKFAISPRQTHEKPVASPKKSPEKPVISSSKKLEKLAISVRKTSETAEDMKNVESPRITPCVISKSVAIATSAVRRLEMSELPRVKARRPTILMSKPLIKIAPKPALDMKLQPLAATSPTAKPVTPQTGSIELNSVIASPHSMIAAPQCIPGSTAPLPVSVQPDVPVARAQKPDLVVSQAVSTAPQPESEIKYVTTADFSANTPPLRREAVIKADVGQIHIRPSAGQQHPIQLQTDKGPIKVNAELEVEKGPEVTSVVKLLCAGGHSVLKINAPARNGSEPKMIKLMPIRKEKAEIIVRTVSEKAKPQPVEDTPDVPVKHAASMSVPTNWFAAGSADTKWTVEQSPRSGIQVRRDYGKPLPGAFLEEAESDEGEDFVGWDGYSREDDVMLTFGLPQLADPSMLDSLVDSISSSDDESWEDSSSPPSPRLTRSELAKQTDFQTRKTRAKSLETCAAKRKKIEI